MRSDLKMKQYIDGSEGTVKAFVLKCVREKLIGMAFINSAF